MRDAHAFLKHAFLKHAFLKHAFLKHALCSRVRPWPQTTPTGQGGRVEGGEGPGSGLGGARPGEAGGGGVTREKARAYNSSESRCELYHELRAQALTGA